MTPTKRKIYFIQPTYRDLTGKLLKGKQLFVYSCAMAALSTTVPSDWEKSFCLEYFDDVDYDTDASVVGISSMGYDMLHGIEIAERFRALGKKVIFGGYQAHFSRERVRRSCDSIVFGNPGPSEMARILRDVEHDELAPEYETGIHLDFPFDYSMLLGRPVKFMPLLSSVGCCNWCSFCCTGTRYTRGYQLRDVRFVIDDIKMLRSHTRHFAFVDSNLYNDREYLLQLCQRIVAERLDIVWGAEATTDIGDDDQALRALRDAGCRLLFVGFESTSKRSLRSANKPNIPECYDAQVKRLHQHGIAVAGYFVVGLDGDTRQTFDELFDFIHRARVNLPIINVLLPAPGTPVFERLQREGRLHIASEEDFLRNALFYNISCSRCFYQPLRMQPEEVEERLLELRQRLSTSREILRRSRVGDVRLALFLFAMNLDFRREARRMIRQWQGSPRYASSAGGRP
jgi:hypothetical protein